MPCGAGPCRSLCVTRCMCPRRACRRAVHPAVLPALPALAAAMVPQEQKWGYRADSLGAWIELEVGALHTARHAGCRRCCRWLGSKGARWAAGQPARRGAPLLLLPGCAPEPSALRCCLKSVAAPANGSRLLQVSTEVPGTKDMVIVLLGYLRRCGCSGESTVYMACFLLHGQPRCPRPAWLCRCRMLRFAYLPLK